MNHANPVDEAAIQRLRDWGGDKLLEEMIALFVKNTPERIAAAATGVENGDAAAVQRAAHSLKSTAANLGASPLVELAREIERHAAASDLTSASPLVKDLARVYEPVRQHLERESHGSHS